MNRVNRHADNRRLPDDDCDDHRTYDDCINGSGYYNRLNRADYRGFYAADDNRLD